MNKEGKNGTSGSNINSPSSSDDDGGGGGGGGSYGKHRAKKLKRFNIKDEEDEKEEGEVEDEDSDADSEGFNDGYDENLVGDEEDQIRLANMNEKEREMELFTRSEKREVLKTRYEIERKLRMAKKKEMMQSQTKMRSNERRRNMEEKKKVKNAIKGLKEQREKRKQKQRLRAIDIYSSSSSSDGDDDDDDEKPIKKKSSSSSSSSSSSDDEKGRRRSDKDDDGDGGVDSDDEPKEKEEDFILTLEELTKIRLSRYRLAEWCHAPFFRDTVVGCFVKVFIGYRERNSTHEKVPVYKLCQIVSVQEGPKIYKLEDTRTNKMVSVKHANDVKNFRLEIVSNNPFTQIEFDEWKYRMERDKLELPGKELISKKQADIHNAVNYSYKDSDIEAIVKEKGRYKSNPVNFAVKKTELLKQKEMAEQLGNLDEVERITQEIDDLESKAKELDLKRTQSISAISYINERNRMRNIKESEIAIMEAREKEKEQVDDPFRRRKCAPMLVHKFGRAANNSANSTPGNTESSSGLDSLIPKPGSSAIVGGIKLEKDLNKPGSPKSNEAQNNDLYFAHNFEIQIDVDIGGSMNHSTASNASSSSAYSSLYPNHSLTPSSKPSTSRRSLNLDEYKKKKGLI